MPVWGFSIDKTINNGTKDSVEHNLVCNHTSD